MSRPSWDDYFLGMAEAASARGDCTRSKVGAVLVEDRTHRILSTGYNGYEPGKPGCLSGTCPRGTQTYSERGSGGDYSDCIATHAERNCLEYALKYYNTEAPLFEEFYMGFFGCTMYVTRKPCGECEHLLRIANVRRAVWRDRTLVEHDHDGDLCLYPVASLDLTPPEF